MASVDEARADAFAQRLTERCKGRQTRKQTPTKKGRNAVRDDPDLELSSTKVTRTSVDTAARVLRYGETRG